MELKDDCDWHERSGEETMIVNEFLAHCFGLFVHVGKWHISGVPSLGEGRWRWQGQWKHKTVDKGPDPWTSGGAGEASWPAGARARGGRRVLTGGATMSARRWRGLRHDTVKWAKLGFDPLGEREIQNKS